MTYWMKDVLKDLEHYCEENRLSKIQQSLADTKKILDEEIRLREEDPLSLTPRLAGSRP